MRKYQARVEKGIELLDGINPGWRNGVNLNLLDMGSCEFCILGQVYGGYTEGIAALLLLWAADDFLYGFDAAPVAGARPRYGGLLQEWLRQLQDT